MAKAAKEELKLYQFEITEKGQTYLFTVAYPNKTQACEEVVKAVRERAAWTWTNPKTGEKLEKFRRHNVKYLGVKSHSDFLAQPQPA